MNAINGRFSLPRGFRSMHCLIIGAFVALNVGGAIPNAVCAERHLFEIVATSLTVPQGGSETIKWDVTRNGVTKRGTVKFGEGTYTASQMATALADSINAEVPGAATPEAEFVEMAEDVSEISTRNGSLDAVVNLEVENFISLVQSEFDFDADPDTGEDFLLAPGHFEVTGAGGIDVSFDAPTNTTANELAVLLGDAMSSTPGYDVDVIGSTVRFKTPSPGRVAFLPNGPGLEYVLGTPQPIPAVSEWGLSVMTLLLLTVGTVVLGRRRRPAAM